MSLELLVVNWQDRLNPKAGGAESHLHEVFGRLVARGHRVTLLASGWPGAPRRATIDGLDVHRTGGRHSFGLAAVRYYRGRFRDRRFDVLVEDLNKVPVFSPLWAREPVVLLVHHLFGPTAFEQVSPPLAAATWLLEKPIPLVYRRIDVEAVSASTRDDLVQRGLDPAMIRVIPNGVDARRFTPAPELRARTPTILYLGRLKRYKRIDLVIRAVAELLGAGRNVRLVIAGQGDEERSLRALAAALGLEAAIEFAGYVAEAEKLRLLRSAWVHALTSSKEGWGIANLEAAACGTPTVASDAPGLRDSVVHGETGFLVPHGDVAALARRLGQVLDDVALRARLGQNAVAFARRHSWDTAADRTEAHLRAVRDAHGEARPAGGVRVSSSGGGSQS